MYERSRRSAKSCTNCSRSAGVRTAQCRPSARLAVSVKSKMSLAIARMAARRSLALAGCFMAGSSSSLSTRWTCPRSCVVGSPAAASRPGASRASVSAAVSPSARTIVPLVRCRMQLDLAEDVLGQQLFEVHGRLHLADASVGLDELVRAARADADVLLADEPLGLDGRDGVFLQLDAGVDL